MVDGKAWSASAYGNYGSHFSFSVFILGSVYTDDFSRSWFVVCKGIKFLDGVWFGVFYLFCRCCVYLVVFHAT